MQNESPTQTANKYFDHYYARCFNESIQTKGNAIESIIKAKMLSKRLSYIMIDFCENDNDSEGIEFYKKTLIEVEKI